MAGCWLSWSHENMLLSRRGLPPFGPGAKEFALEGPLPPNDIPLKPLTRAPSSRCCPRFGPEAVGVSVGVIDAALPGPYSWNLAALDCNAVGKLAVDGTGEGVHDRISA